jgi:enoyl-CoA hydratase
VTGGLELALHCDFLLASERARFADTHARVGVLPGWGMTVLLPQAVGLRAARDMTTTGRFVDAAEALRLGLVTRLVPHDRLVDAAVAVGEEIATNEPAALTELLASYRYCSQVDAHAGLVHEQEVSARWRRTSFDPAAVAARRDAVIERGRSRI